jgi:hypothetical protein
MNESFRELFIQPDDGDPTLAALHFDYVPDHSLYAPGFEDAAEILMNALKKKGGDNVLVYPIVFLLRHAIELYLKDNISRALELAGKDPLNEFKNLWHTHKASRRFVLLHRGLYV